MLAAALNAPTNIIVNMRCTRNWLRLTPLRAIKITITLQMIGKKFFLMPKFPHPLTPTQPPLLYTFTEHFVNCISTKIIMIFRKILS